MALEALLAKLALVVGGMVLLSTVMVVDTRRSVAGVWRWRDRLGEIWPHLVLFGAVLVLNRVARTYGPEVSWVLGWNITPLIYRIEGETISVVQSVSSPEMTAITGFVYIYGYAFLLVFPLVAYFLLSDSEPLKHTLVAFVVNYAIGVAFYTIFVAYGPRNLLPDLVDPLLYDEYPISRLLTAQVNANTNVFPSLHASLATSVAVLSWGTRDEYPYWPLLAIPLAIGVYFSTMYLGIHWVIDVLAGVCLGTGSVALARRVV